MRQSAGTLLYRDGPSGLEVLLIHASGAYNRKAPWNLAKGEPDEGERDLEKTARRETLEETGIEVTGPLISLGHADYSKSGKRIFCFTGPAPEGVEPRVASWEIDQARFMPIAEARELLHPDLQVFLDRLEEHLRK